MSHELNGALPVFFLGQIKELPSGNLKPPHEHSHEVEDGTQDGVDMAYQLGDLFTPILQNR